MKVLLPFKKLPHDTADETENGAAAFFDRRVNV
jgi:hypothetical protein